MIVVLPVCHKDEHLALQNLEWARHLNDQINYKCVITHDTKFNPSKVAEAARKCFREVETQSYLPCPMPDKWPIPHNWAWQSTARILSSQPEPWLWWEQDAIPLVKGWVEKIDGFYKAGGKPFCGPIVDAGAYMAGVGVYPHDVFNYKYTVALIRQHPFDIFAGREFVKHATNASHLIIHVKKPVHFECLDEITGFSNNGSVLFHKCKDGSLINVLRSVEQRQEQIPTVGKVKHLIAENYDRIMRYLKSFRETRSAVAFVQLGSLGDILNILPILKLYSRHGWSKPVVYVSQQYEKVITGTDYGKFQIWAGGVGDVQGAEAHAKSRFKNVFVPQLFGNGIAINGKTEHFNRDHYLKCDMLDYFGKLPLEFNRRNYDREKTVIQNWVKTSKPILLLALCGKTSPFNDADKFKSEIVAKYGSDFEIIDLNSFELEYFYDYLALYDIADLLITVDTSHVHLLGASHVPFVYLMTNRDKWFQAEIIRKPVLAIGYNDAMARISEIHFAIEQAYSNWKSKQSMRFFHVTERHGKNGSAEYERKLRAFKSWEFFYNTGQMIPRHYWEYKRDARLIGDKRDLPFLKDVIGLCLEKTSDNDVVLLTNDDVWLKNGLIEKLRLKMKHVDMATCSRLDVDSVEGLSGDTAPNYFGGLHYGRDVLAIRCGWLRKNFALIPDFILGASDWDICMLAMARWLRGLPTTFYNWDCVFAECELERGYVFHERHDAIWSRDSNQNTAPSQIYNRTLCKRWLGANMPIAEFPHLLLL